MFTRGRTSPNVFYLSYSVGNQTPIIFIAEHAGLEPYDPITYFFNSPKKQ